MTVQVVVVRGQRCHWYEKVIGVVPLHVPLRAVSTFPRASVPVKLGTAVLAGRVVVPPPPPVPVPCVIASVGDAVAVAVPAVLRAVTTTATVEPTSAVVGMYVDDVAEAMFEQAPPEALHRCHW